MLSRIQRQDGRYLRLRALKASRFAHVPWRRHLLLLHHDRALLGAICPWPNSFWVGIRLLDDACKGRRAVRRGARKPVLGRAEGAPACIACIRRMLQGLSHHDISLSGVCLQWIARQKRDLLGATVCIVVCVGHVCQLLGSHARRVQRLSTWTGAKLASRSRFLALLVETMGRALLVLDTVLLQNLASAKENQYSLVCLTSMRS